LNSHGQLGQNNRIYYSSPVQIPGTTWSSVSGGYAHSLATKTGGTLWGWGGNTEGQLGQNSVSASPFAGVSSPVQIPGNTWSSIASGGSGTGVGHRLQPRLMELYGHGEEIITDN
jgi:alpha-tubulin suppressor-like RCC1 family protein